ncbi:MAG: hypothetical protein MMC33_010195 [Icmadophila ericetorum]|nr:hypothetical protein [Icmadophila ericetorum]
MAHEDLNKPRDQDSLRRPWLTKKLQEWREIAVQKAFPGTYLQVFPSLILPDSLLAALADWAEYIHDEQSMWRWIGGGWDGLQRHGPEILQILERSKTMRPDKGEVFDEWVRHNDIVRKRIPAVGGNRDLEDFEQRRASWLISQGQKAKRLDSGPAAKKRGGVKEKAKRRQLKNRPEVGGTVILR